MSKPSSIRTATFLLYIDLLYIMFNVVMSISNNSDDFNAGVIPLLIVRFILPIALALFFLNKRKYWPTLIMGFFVLWLSSIDLVTMVLSFASLLFLFNRKSRDYLRNVSDRLGEEAQAIDIDATVDPVEAEATVEPDEAAAEPSSGKEALPGGEKREGEATAAVSAAKKPKPSADPVIEIREAAPGDAEVIHSLMMEAFEEFRKAVPPSSALNETAEGIREALESGKESAAILYEDNLPSAMIRYKLDGDAIYFFRLSVVPARRKRGLARMLVEWIEQKGRSKGMSRSTCMVRQTVHRNLVMYENMGYEVTGQELFVRPEGSVTSLKLEKYIGL
ncbi:GNAT family N-acetyltransferase [Cohnella sp. AR92]|uniref:GNAT family N-acetyltransferase n=1 Tax=Cohnella sp. AR92 TaxID=648716 RepID=UPI0013150ECB|nr:GNAT family N-acetyltransferase [Cohnella sp. AR92]